MRSLSDLNWKYHVIGVCQKYLRIYKNQEMYNTIQRLFCNCSLEFSPDTPSPDIDGQKELKALFLDKMRISLGYHRLAFLFSVITFCPIVSHLVWANNMKFHHKMR